MYSIFLMFFLRLENKTHTAVGVKYLESNEINKSVVK